MDQKLSARRIRWPAALQVLFQVDLVAVRAGHSLRLSAQIVVILFFRKPPVRRTAATEVQEMFSHFALISVELANSFWPRKLSAAPIGRLFQVQSSLKRL